MNSDPNFIPISNIGQAQILAAQSALKHLRGGGESITVRQLMMLCGVAEESARKALKKLQKKGLLEQRIMPGTGTPRAWFLKAP